MNPGDPIIVHLISPNEKFWGLLHRIELSGVVFLGINLSSFDDWVGGVSRGEETLGLVTMFLPMARVERIFVDEPVGSVESYCEQFERRVGHTIEEHLGLAGPDPEMVS